MARVEEEITTLRTVLQSKVRHASELKRKLGITVWREMSDDVSQSLKTVKESNVLVLSISFLILGLHILYTISMEKDMF